MHKPGGVRSALRAGRSLQVELVRADDLAWDGRLDAVRHDIYHTAGYHRYAQGSGEGEPFLVVVGDRGRGLAWPYLLRRVAEIRELAGSEATDVTSVYGYPGPLAWGCATGDPFLGRAWTEVLAVWREQRAIAAFTRFHPLLDNASLMTGLSLPQSDDGSVTSVLAGGPTVSIDLTLDENAIRAAYGRGRRGEIRAARRAGLATSPDDEFAELATFARLYHETMVRNNASAYYFFDLPDFQRLRAALAGRLHLLLTRAGDRVAAAGLFTEYDGIVEWLLVGTDEQYISLSPTKVLVDDAVTWARRRGNTVLHLGGGRGRREDSLLWFKSRFSRRRHPFHTGRWVLDRAGYRDLLAAHPEGLVQGGAHPFFPAYRAPGMPPDAPWSR